MTVRGGEIEQGVECKEERIYESEYRSELIKGRARRRAQA
jgi:hypothetical protein